MESRGTGIKVHGLAELQRELRTLDSSLPRQLRVANMKAAEIVAVEARSRATAQGSTLAKAAPSIKAMAQQRSASVRIGGNKYPFALGAEFGSIRFHQFKAWRGNGSEAGYALYPAIRTQIPRVLRVYDDLIREATRPAFPS